MSKIANVRNETPDPSVNLELWLPLLELLYLKAAIVQLTKTNHKIVQIGSTQSTFRQPAVSHPLRPKEHYLFINQNRTYIYPRTNAKGVVQLRTKRKPNQINTPSCSETYNSLQHRKYGARVHFFFVLFVFGPHRIVLFVVVLANVAIIFEGKKRDMPENTCLHVADTNDAANESGFSAALCILRAPVLFERG